MKAIKKIRGVIEKPAGSGRFYAQWFDAGGQRCSEFGGTQALALAIYQKRKTEIREGRLFPAAAQRRITFGDICDEFKAAKPGHWSLGTPGVRKGLFGFLREWFADVPAAGLGAQKITEKFNELRAKKRKPSTLNRYRAVGSAIYSWAILNDRVAANPFKKIRLEHEFNKRVRYLNQYEPRDGQPTEEERLRLAIREIAPEYEAELDLAINTGMRQGEQYSLTWRQVDFASRSLHLPKTKAGTSRHVPLNDAAIAALKQLKRLERGLVCEPTIRRDGHERATGNPRWWFEAAVTKAAIPDFRWHDLRHTFASWAVQRGADLPSLQRVLGHATLTMTLRYAHLQPKQLHDVVNLLPGPARGLQVVARQSEVA